MDAGLRKKLLIGGGIALAGVVGYYLYSKGSVSASAGGASIDLTPPTITIGSYPSQAPQTSMTTSSPLASGGCPSGQVSYGGGCMTPRRGYTRGSGNLSTLGSGTLSSMGGYTPFPIGSPGFSTGGLPVGGTYSPRLYSGAGQTPFTPQTVLTPFAVG